VLVFCYFDPAGGRYLLCSWPAEDCDPEAVDDAKEGPDLDEADEDEAPLQEVRYLRVRNESGGDLRVFARIGDGPTWNWDFAPGEAAYLAVDGERLAAAEVYLWAVAEGKRWPTYEQDPLALVREPYRAEAVATFTYTFNP
jgi:hypothetical protein